MTDLILSDIENKIYNIRNTPVMLDSDLAELYGVAPKRLNEQVQRNIDRFPSRYMFQLNFNEWVSLRSQFATLKNSRGQHKKYLPYVFSEQGVAMLSGILKSEMAVKISISIIDAFVLLRKSNIQNHVLRKIITLENKQLETDKKIDYIFDALEKADTTPTQGIFFNGQIFDAYTFASEIIKRAKKSIILIDNYVDESTLAILSKRAKNVEAIIYTNKQN
jgi:hypothetical protein